MPNLKIALNNFHIYLISKVEQNRRDNIYMLQKYSDNSLFKLFLTQNSASGREDNMNEILSNNMLRKSPL